MSNSDPTNHAYSFEICDETHRNRKRAQPDFEKLCLRLNLDMNGPEGALKKTLEDLVIHCHLPIKWYHTSIKKRVGEQRFFIWGSVFLLIALPFLSSHVSAGNATPHIAALLAGLLAVYRGISQWMAKSQNVAIFSQARATLKSLLYQFEDKWSDQNVNQSLADFDHDLQTLLATCHTVTNKERELYYENMSLPTFNISTSLLNAGKQSTQLISQFASPINESESKKTAAALQAREEILSTREQLVDIKEQLANCDDAEAKRQLNTKHQELEKKHQEHTR
ncbi:MAG: hypothetical protein COA42_15795 [Alteromonadaceae bacterium]|nr:MAG: hypothetical protein COA42_15795 [Alteromonadaceae bacterium]